MDRDTKEVIKSYSQFQEKVSPWLWDNSMTIFKPYEEMGPLEVFAGAVPDLLILTKDKAGVSDLIEDMLKQLDIAGKYLDNGDNKKFKEYSQKALTLGLSIVDIPFTLDRNKYSERLIQKIFYLFGAVNTALAYAVNVEFA